MWAVVFSADLTVLRVPAFPLPWRGPACPAHLGCLIPALVTLQQPRDVWVSRAAAPESPALAAKRCVRRQGKPEPGRALGSLPGASAKFSELLPRAGLQGIPVIPGRAECAGTVRCSCVARNKILQFWCLGRCAACEGCPGVARHREMAPPAPSTSWHPQPSSEVLAVLCPNPFPPEK